MNEEKPRTFLSKRCGVIGCVPSFCSIMILMNQEFLSVREKDNDPPEKPEPVKHEIKHQEHKPNVAPPKEKRSLESKLLITTLVLFFVALNVWGYYFYKRGFFGISADISKTPTPTPQNLEKSDSIYMIPGI